MARDKLGKNCSLWYCNDKHYANNLCHRHYLNVRRYGNVVSPKNTDLKNALRAVNELVRSIKKCGDTQISTSADNILDRIGNTENINVIGRCNKCKMDKIATMWWPNVTISCGCEGESTIRLDEKEFDLPDLFIV